MFIFSEWDSAAIVQFFTDLQPEPRTALLNALIESSLACYLILLNKIMRTETCMYVCMYVFLPLASWQTETADKLSKNMCHFM